LLAGDEALTVDCVGHPGIFPTALVAHSLPSSTSPQVSAIVAPAISFLERETVERGFRVHCTGIDVRTRATRLTNAQSSMSQLVTVDVDWE